MSNVAGAKRKPRRAYHHGDLKQALANVGLQLLDEVGADFTLRQVAQRAGVTHGAAYRHYESKEALLAELARRGFVDLTLAIDRAMRLGSPARGKLEALLKAYVRFAWGQPALYEVMFGRRLNEEGSFPDLEEAVQGAVRLLRVAVADYLGDDDELRARDLSIGLWSLAHGFTANVLHRRIHVRSVRRAQRYLVEVSAPFLEGALESPR
ncbi:MAG: TetR/AcrR family transcriptional regulator [Polyangiales bacterium]